MNERTVQVKHTCPLCVAPVRNIARGTAEREEASAPMRGGGAARPSTAAAQTPTREPPPSLLQRADELQGP